MIHLDSHLDKAGNLSLFGGIRREESSLAGVATVTLLLFSLLVRFRLPPALQVVALASGAGQRVHNLRHGNIIEK